MKLFDQLLDDNDKTKYYEINQDNKSLNFTNDYLCYFPYLDSIHGLYDCLSSFMKIELIYVKEYFNTNDSKRHVKFSRDNFIIYVIEQTVNGNRLIDVKMEFNNSMILIRNKDELDIIKDNILKYTKFKRCDS